MQRFCWKIIIKLSKKLDYNDFRKQSDEYEYGNRQEVKKKIELRLER